MFEESVRLRIQLMGILDIYSGEMSLALNQLKSRTLLFYLAVTGWAGSRNHENPFNPKLSFAFCKNPGRGNDAPVTLVGNPYSIFGLNLRS